MLRSALSLKNYKIAAKDGELGRVQDLLLDDRLWIVRYLVANTGPWLMGRRVLLSHAALKEPDWMSGRLSVDLTKEQVQKSPALSEAAPVSMQFEIDLHKHYAWPRYWGVHGHLLPPETLVETPAGRSATERGDPHLRSTNEISGYHIKAADGEIGHIEDFVVDDEIWWIRYMIVDTRNWLPGRKVLVAPSWFDRVSWGERKVECSLTRDEIKNSPQFDPAAPVNREYEERLYDFYGRPRYWAS